MQKVKIIQVVEDLKIGGIEKVICNIALGLNKDRYDVEVWCLVSGGDIADFLLSKGIIVRILNLNSYHSPKNILRLSRQIRRHKGCILHLHGYFASTFGRLASFLVSTSATISHVHTTYYDFKKRNMLIEKILSHTTDAIVCVSGAVKEFVVNIEGIDESKTRLIYNGVAGPMSQNDKKTAIDGNGIVKLAKRDIHIITVGSLTRHKGHRVLFDAINILLGRTKKIKATIVGDGPLRGELEKYVRFLGFDDMVTFTGEQVDVFSLLKMADIFVLPSTEREGLGMAIIEAMSVNLPAIGSRIGGIPEVIEDHVSGILVRPGDSRDLAAAIERLVEDSVLREELGKAGREIFEKKFDILHFNRRIENLYQDVLGRCKR